MSLSKILPKPSLATYDPDVQQQYRKQQELKQNGGVSGSQLVKSGPPPYGHRKGWVPRLGQRGLFVLTNSFYSPFLISSRFHKLSVYLTRWSSIHKSDVFHCSRRLLNDFIIIKNVEKSRVNSIFYRLRYCLYNSNFIVCFILQNRQLSLH